MRFSETSALANSSYLLFEINYLIQTKGGSQGTTLTRKDSKRNKILTQIYKDL